MAPPISMMMQLRAVPRGLAFPAAFNVNGRSVSPVAAAPNAMVPSFRASRLFMSLFLVIQHKLDPVQDRPLHIFGPDASISFKRLKRDFHFCRSRTTGKTGKKDILNNFRIGLAARQQLFD